MAKASTSTRRKPLVPKVATIKGRSLAEFQPLLAAERRVLIDCAAGRPAMFGALPAAQKRRGNVVRAEFIRFLALGGDAQAVIHERGVVIVGAFVAGTLDLSDCIVTNPLRLFECRFEKQIDVARARLPMLNLRGSAVPALNGDHLRCSGPVFLREGFSTSGEVRLSSARIDGSVDFSSANLVNPGGDAIMMDRAKIGGSVVMDGVTVHGEVRLLKAEIGGGIDGDNAQFLNKDGDALSLDSVVVAGNLMLNRITAEGQIRLHGATIRGTLECINSTIKNPAGITFNLAGCRVGQRIKFTGSTFNGRLRITSAVAPGIEFGGATLDEPNGFALQLGGATISEALLFRDVKKIAGAVDLTDARIGTLADDEASWAMVAKVNLDGFRYERIHGPCDSRMRIDWLKKQAAENLGEDFRPQPWEQLARTLREMGYLEEARSVSIEKQEARRRAGVIGRRDTANCGFWRSLYRRVANFLSVTLHWFYGLFAGYGHRPLLTLMWMIGAWLGCAGGYWVAETQGVLGPGSPIIQVSPALASCGAPGDRFMDTAKHQHSAEPWTRCAAMPPAYTTYNSLIYSLDLLLPVVDLQQQEAWSPMVSNKAGETLWWGEFARLLLWIEILFGWTTSALLIAVLGKLVDKD